MYLALLSRYDLSHNLLDSIYHCEGTSLCATALTFIRLKCGDTTCIYTFSLSREINMDGSCLFVFASYLNVNFSIVFVPRVLSCKLYFNAFYCIIHTYTRKFTMISLSMKTQTRILLVSHSTQFLKLLTSFLLSKKITYSYLPYYIQRFCFRYCSYSSFTYLSRQIMFSLYSMLKKQIMTILFFEFNIVLLL